MRAKTVVIALVSMLGLAVRLAGAGQAAEATVVPLITLDTTELELVQRSATNKHVDFAIPARLNTAGVEIRRWSIAQGGRLIDSAGTQIKLGPIANARTTVIASFDLDHLDIAGPYIATVELAAPPEPPPAVPKGGSDASATTTPSPEQKDREQTVQLKLNKPAAELRVSTPLQIERTVWLPCLSFLEPDRITFNEAAGKSWVRTDPNSWNVVLRRANEPEEGRRLKVQLPAAIDGWGQADASVALDGWISLGTTSGTLTVRAPQLAAQTVDFPVTIVSHLSRIWLVVTIILGILLGWYFRDVLDKRRERLEATIPAQQELDTATALIAKTVDKTFKQSLIDARTNLDKVARANASTAQQIKDATAKAIAEREKIVKEIADLVAKVKTARESWEKVGHDIGPVPVNVRTELGTLRRVLEQSGNRLNNGDLTGLDKELDDGLTERREKLHDAVKTWVETFVLDVDDLKKKKPWPDTKIPDAIAAIDGDGSKLKTSADAAMTADAVATLVADTARLLATFRDRLSGRGVRDVRTIAHVVSEALTKRDSKLKGEAGKIDKTAEQLPAKADGDAALDEAETLVAALNAAHDAIVAGLTVAWNDASKELPGLSAGSFTTALNELANKPKPAQQQLGDDDRRLAQAKPATTADELRDLLAEADAVPAGAAPAWTIELEAPDAFAFEPVLVRIKVRAPTGQNQPEVTLRWSENGQFIGATEPGILQWSFYWAQAAPVTIEVTATDRNGVTAQATRTINVRLRDTEMTVGGLQVSLEKVTYAQKLVAGALIVAGGWVIFSPNFIGNFTELFGALLWGFSVDVGSAKLGELTEQVKGLKPTIPVPKANG
jgi:hypothetical protein